VNRFINALRKIRILSAPDDRHHGTLDADRLAPWTSPQTSGVLKDFGSWLFGNSPQKRGGKPAATPFNERPKYGIIRPVGGTLLFELIDR